MERPARQDDASVASPRSRYAVVETVWPIVACALVALGLRLLAIQRPPSLDEAAALGVVDVTTWRGWARALLREPSPPAFPVLLTAWAIPGGHVAWLRLLPVVCGITTVVAGMIWTRRESVRATRSVGILLAVSPFLLRYGVELRAYGLLGLASMVAFASAWSIAQADDGEERALDRWLLLAGLSLACATHFTAILLIPSVAVLLLIGANGPARSRLPLRTFALALAVWAVFVVVARGPLEQVRGDWWMPELDWTVLWRVLAEAFGIVTTGEGPGAVSAVIGAGLTAGAVAVLVAAPRDRAWLAPLAASGVYMAGLALVSMLWRPVWWPRTLLPAVLAATVAFGMALSSIDGRVWRRVATAGLGVVLGAWLVMWVSGHPEEGLEPWPLVASIIAEDPRPGAVLAFPDFVAWPLASVPDPRQPLDVRPIRLDGKGRREALMTLPEWPRRTYLVIRLDLGLMKHVAAMDAFLAALAERVEHRGAVTVLLVQSRDISIAPQLGPLRGEVEHHLGRFGPGRVRHEGPWLTVLTYGSTTFEPAGL